MKILFLMIIIITFSCGGGKAETMAQNKYITPSQDSPVKNAIYR